MPEIRGIAHIVDDKFYKLPYVFYPETGFCKFYKSVVITETDCFIEGEPDVSKELLEFVKSLIMQEIYKKIDYEN